MNGFLNYIKEPSLKLPLEDYKYLHNLNNNITGISTLSTAHQKFIRIEKHHFYQLYQQ